MLKNKEEMKEEMYKSEIEWLKELSPLDERKLFPLPTDGFEMFSRDLDIARLEGIKIKGVRKLLKEHQITDDIELIKEELYKFETKLDSFYSSFKPDDEEEDIKWLNVINNQMYDEYGVKYNCFKTLTIQANNVRASSPNRRYIVTKMAEICHKKKEEWKEILIFDPTYEIKNGWLFARKGDE